MSDNTVTKWVGWVWFAAIVMLIAGVFDALHGLAANFAPGSAYFVRTEGALLLFDVQGWGWWHLIIGIALIIGAAGLFRGATWARVVAVILVSISGVSQLFLLPTQPWLSIIVIALDVLVIYAIIVHGREMAARTD